MAELQSELSVVAQNAAQQIYFKELGLQIAISYIANTISKCEFKVYEKNKEVQNELYYMLNVSPNPNQSSSQFLNALVTRYYRNGEVLVFPDGSKNRLYVADGFSMDERTLSENIFNTITIGNETLKRKYKASDVFYFRLDDVRIKKLIDGAFEQYGTVMQAAIEGFVRRNGKKYKLILDQYKAGDPEFKQLYESILKKQLETFVKSANAVYPQFRGQNLEEFDKTAAGNYGSSADVIAVRKEMFDVIAQAFKIPLSMMYGNITNINDMINMFLTFTIDPLADMISEEITRKMYPFNEWKKGNYVKCDTSCIAHVDILDVADKVMNLIGSGAVCIDEVRNRIDMPPLNNDLGKHHFVTRNYATPEEVLEPTEKNEESTDKGNELPKIAENNEVDNENTAKEVNEIGEE
jgi:HK97 family phage portal protein